MSRMKEKKGHWIGGTLTAFPGVTLVRLVWPELPGAKAEIVLTLGRV